MAHDNREKEKIKEKKKASNGHGFENLCRITENIHVEYIIMTLTRKKTK